MPYSFVQGHPGNVMKVVNDQGNIVEQYECDPFGARSIYDGPGNSLSVSAYGVSYGFQGRRHDAETGLMYFRNGSYDPHLGRFLTVDPIGVWGDGGDGGDGGNGGNGFVHGSKIGEEDPLGLETWIILYKASPFFNKDLAAAERRVALDPDGGGVTVITKDGKSDTSKIRSNPNVHRECKEKAGKVRKRWPLKSLKEKMQKRKGKLVIAVWPGHGNSLGPGKRAINNPNPDSKETVETKATIDREKDLSAYFYKRVIMHVTFSKKPDVLIVKACYLGKGAP